MSTVVDGICRNQKPNAPVGEYEIKVQAADSAVTLQGFHAINGKRQTTWSHAELFNSSKKFTVQAKQRHQTIVIATFLPGANAGSSKVTVTIQTGGADAMVPCVLQPGGMTTSSMSILAPL
jgi:hypothetical protein